MKKKILIIEDNHDIQLIEKTALELNGYEVDTASSVEDSLSLLQDENYALIILDILMPNSMDGYELIKYLKNSEFMQSKRNIPVIIVSAQTETESVIRGLQEGAVSYVRKPFRIEELVAAVKMADSI